MPKDDGTASRQLYANLMDEAKGRFNAIEAALNGRLGLPDLFAEEFCYLQLRLLCEIIALGCVIAHDSMGPIEIKRLAKRYDADDIIKELERYHSDFYPHPIILTVTKPCPEKPNGEAHIERKAAGFLTKAELLKLYGRTGNYLHRGKIKDLQSRPPYKAIDKAMIVSWTNKIVALLDVHHIAASDNRQHWIVILSNADDNGRVQVGLALSPLPEN